MNNSRKNLILTALNKATTKATRTLDLEALAGTSRPIKATVRIEGTLQIGQPTTRRPSWDPWALLGVLLAEDPEASSLLRLAASNGSLPTGEELLAVKASVQAALHGLTPPGEPTSVRPRVTFAGDVTLVNKPKAPKATK